MRLTTEQVKSLLSGDTLVIDGFSVELTIGQDDSMEAPWKESDGNGVISEPTTRRKQAGEKILYWDRGISTYYNIAETIKKATEEGWGLSEEESKGLTKKQIIAKSVDNNFERMKAWCDNKWHYVIFTVKVRFEGTKMGSMSSGGLESDHIEHNEDVVQECFETAMNEAKAALPEKVKLWTAQATRLGM